MLYVWAAIGGSLIGTKADWAIREAKRPHLIHAPDIEDPMPATRQSPPRPMGA
ncbi:MAG: hypothetical protein Q8R28_04875 [Dehalococcoidia bacterium]|nr:hypothetical protein [Dehalococcoidia bacterium]